MSEIRENIKITDDDINIKSDDMDSDMESDMYSVNETDSDVDNDGDNDDDDDDKEILEDINTIQKQPFFIQPDDNDNDDEEEDIDENYLQKFDESIKKKIIADFHPELKQHNYDEIEVLSRVVRDSNGNIVDPLHKTLPFITKYEKTRILGERASQLNSGAKALVEVDNDIIDGYIIALKEFDEKKIPFIIKRPLPNGAVEYWKFEDLEVI
jgi:DNA-directed RNA polymerase I, II, and III subunit RPABC2